jgi:prevent-host-death family protein
MKADRVRVLVVDDESATRETYAKHLGAAGFSVSTAGSGKEAFGLIGDHDFDVVLTDFSMLPMSGLDVLRELRNRRADLAVIMVFDTWTNANALEAMEGGAIQCLAKPVGFEELKRTIELALHQTKLVEPLANLRRRLESLTTVSATEAKNQFGQVLESALKDGAVMITKHDTAKAVLLSMDEFGTLVKSKRSRLNALSHEFDAMYARMQRPGAAAAMAAAFNATPEQLGASAVKAARKR